MEIDLNADMSLQVGIVGLPNVGKSTLFKALTKKQVLAENYPFATIEPNVGVVAVPDERLAVLATMSQSKKVVPAAVEFVDIAGLVAGAHKGEGLGNKFLSHIREVDAIVEVVRAFTKADIIHVANKVDPQADVETINLELAMGDLQTVEKRLKTAVSEAKSRAPEALLWVSGLEKVLKLLEAGKPAREAELTDDEAKLVKQLQLLTHKPLLYVVNVDEGAGEEVLPEYLKSQPHILVSAQIESELAELPDEEAKSMMTDLGMQEAGLDRLITAAFELLGLQTYLTTGEIESRAWTIHRGDRAPQAAGAIHSDFERGFISAEIISYAKLVKAGSWQAGKEKGWVRLEGKEYVMQDGDVVLFHFNV